MAFNGSGTFERLYDWETDKANAIKVRADRMDAEMDGFATGLSTCITKDGQTTITANIPMNSKKLTGLAAGSAAGDSVRYEQVFEGASKTAEVTVASDTTCDILGAASDIVAISGTTTITSLGTGTNKIKFVRFTGVLTLTHDGTSLILPGATNITTAAGDTMVVVSDGSSNVRVLAYQSAGGMQLYDVDTLKADTADVLTAGFGTTAYNAGTKSSGTFTPDEANGNHQYAVNGGAHTLAPPTNNCSIVLHYTNNASAGTVTTTGFTVVDGDSLVTTDTYEFICYITKVNDVSHLTVKALQ